MTIHIRPLQEGDHSQWLSLWQSYLSFYKSTVEDSQTARTWQRLCDGVFNLHALVAVDGESLVGMTHYLFHPSTWTDLDYCYLQDLFVREDQRGCGTARALIDAVVQEAKLHPAQRVYWLTKEDNTTARLLYDKVASHTGFIQYRIAPL